MEAPSAGSYRTIVVAFDGHPPPPIVALSGRRRACTATCKRPLTFP